MRCDECTNWLLRRQTVYGDGSVIVNYAPPEGKGHCEVLNLDTPPEFGCTNFAQGEPAVITTHKAGAPWQHSHAGPCPTCNSAGSNTGTACHRCAGTGLVRHYDDGYVGEEQTRLHPKEKELRDRGEPVPEINPGTTLAKIEKGTSGIMESSAL